MGLNTPARIRMVQGSHIVVPKLFDHGRAYIFQNADGRIIFAIPYETDFTLIGTTDRDYDGDPSSVAISEARRNTFVVRLRNISDRRSPAKAWSGPIRACGRFMMMAPRRRRKPRAITLLHLEAPQASAASLSVYGGKLTTYRRLAEHALEKLEPHLRSARGARAAGRRVRPLPGGHFPVEGFDDLMAQHAGRYPFLPGRQVRRLTRAYGTDVPDILGDARSAADLGRAFGGGLTSREIAWLTSREWVMTAD